MDPSGDSGSATESGFIGFRESSQTNVQQNFGYNRNRRGHSNFRHNQFRGGGNRNFGGGNYRGGFHGQRNFQSRQNFQPALHQQKDTPIQVYFHPSMIEDPWTQLSSYRGDVSIKKHEQPDEVSDVDVNNANDKIVLDDATTQ